MMHVIDKCVYMCICVYIHIYIYTQIHLHHKGKTAHISSFSAVNIGTHGLAVTTMLTTENRRNRGPNFWMKLNCLEPLMSRTLCIYFPTTRNIWVSLNG